MSKVMIIAEAGVNHNGKLDLALKLCDAAQKAGVDVIKFQTFITEKNITKTVEMADYQVANTKKTATQWEMIKELELGFEQFELIKAQCDQIGLQFLSTPDDTESLDFLVGRIGVSVIKIGSGEVTNIPFLRAIGKKGLPVILSTGMSILGEVERALFELQTNGAGPISLLHCTTNYPCPLQEVNLLSMLTLKEAFKLPIGYSDHTDGIEIPVAAVALGATIIEKHFTLDKTLPGPDHKASLEPDRLAEMVKAIRDVESALGDGIKKPTTSEQKIMRVVRRSIVAEKPIKKGDLFSTSNLAAKRAGGAGLSVDLWDMMIGKTASRDFSQDELVEL